MGFFSNLKLINVFRESKPFQSLKSIQWRADQILKNVTPDQRESVAAKIYSFIADFKDEQVQDETEQYVSRLYTRGGWELSYLPDDEFDRHPSESDIRELLQNWPAGAADFPDIPTPDDIADL